MRSRPSRGVPVKARYWALGRPCAHIFGQGFILGAVGLIHDHDDIIPIGQQRIFLTLGLAEFLNQGKNNALVLPQKFAHLFAVFGLGGFAFFYCSGIEKVAVDLAVQIVPVGNHHKGEIARELAKDLAGIKDHGKTLARPLGMPENPQFALFFLASEE